MLALTTGYSSSLSIREDVGLYVSSMAMYLALFVK